MNTPLTRSTHARFKTLNIKYKILNMLLTAAAKFSVSNHTSSMLNPPTPCLHWYTITHKHKQHCAINQEPNSQKLHHESMVVFVDCK